MNLRTSDRLPGAAVPARSGDLSWERPGPTTRERRQDIALGLALSLATVGSVLLSRSVGAEGLAARPSPTEEIAWCLAVSLPLTVRRRLPLATLLVCAATFLGQQARGVGEGQVSSICLFLALFTAGAWPSNRTLTRAVRGVVVALMFSWLAYALSATAWNEVLEHTRPNGPLPPKIAQMIFLAAINVMYFGAAWVFGDRAFSAAFQRAQLEQRNAELARERDENARRAVLEERVRIARELHDVVAHHVSVMGIQAGAARVVIDHDPTAAKIALTAIEHAARNAVEELRRLLGVLRSPSPVSEPDAGPDAGSVVSPRGARDSAPQVAPDFAPAPRLDGIPDLVAAARRSGLAVEYAVVGEPLEVPPGIALSAYRVVQEALTNTLRHAAAARADVRLRYLAGGSRRPAEVEVEVVDDGRPSVATRPPGVGRGLGLVGMRERVDLHGGELETGIRPEGGFRVRARFPMSTLE